MGCNIYAVFNGLNRAKRWQGDYSDWEYCWCSDTRKVCRHRSWIRWSCPYENPSCMYY